MTRTLIFLLGNLRSMAGIRALENEEKEITVDHARLRENITALSKTPGAKQLITRYILKAGSEETRIEVIARERRHLEISLPERRNRMAAEIRGFTFEKGT